jgi:hypothetical protein
MQNRLLEAIGNGLAKKPFEWVSWWWWGPKWVAFISVDPPVTVNNPLWRREENNLKSVRLFGLSPDELQAEIILYWQQPFWKRWLLGLFTSINRKIKLWSYYHRCLSFREVCIENLFDIKKPIDFVFEQYLGEVTRWFNKNRIQLENYIEKHAGNLRAQNNLNFSISIFLKENWQFFSKLMEKKISQLPIEDKNGLRRQLEKECHRLQDTLSCYLSTWFKNIFNLPTSSDEPINSEFIEAVEKETSCSIHSIKDWVSMKQQVVVSMLQEESPEQFLQIKNFLQSCLSMIRLLVEHQVTRYEKLIDKIRYNRFNREETIQQAEILQTELIYFFKKSFLLFHPDKSFGNEKLQEIQTELFKEFKQLSKESLEKVKEGLQTLKICLPKQRNAQELRKMEEGFDLRIAKLKQVMEELDAKIEQVRAQIEADLKQTRAEMDANHKQTRIEIEEMKIKIDEFIKSQAFLKLINKQSSNGFIQEENKEERANFYGP